MFRLRWNGKAIESVQLGILVTILSRENISWISKWIPISVIAWTIPSECSRSREQQEQVRLSRTNIVQVLIGESRSCLKSKCKCFASFFRALLQVLLFIVAIFSLVKLVILVKANSFVVARTSRILSQSQNSPDQEIATRDTLDVVIVKRDFAIYFVLLFFPLSSVCYRTTNEI